MTGNVQCIKAAITNVETTVPTYRQDRDRQTLAYQRLDIHQECAGKQQQRQHSVQDQAFEIDLTC